jgi:hypothetical protein
MAHVSDPSNPFGDLGADAPLFRELERVLRSSSGPVNWELARQVAVASAAEAGDDRDPTDDDRRALDEAVRVAELHVARFTGLEPPGDVAQVRAVRRAGWVAANLESLEGLLEPAATRAAAATERALVEQMPPEAAGLGGALESLQGRPAGWILLGLVALGLIGFGIHDFAQAFYRRIDSARVERAVCDLVDAEEPQRS